MSRSNAVKELRAGQFRSSLVLDFNSKDEMFIKTKPMFQRELRKVLREIEHSARFYVRRKHHVTGALERSIHAQTTLFNYAGGQRIGGIVTAGSRLAPYAWYVHDGADPHVITAKKGGMLVFYGKRLRLRSRVRVGKKATSIPGIYDDVYGPGYVQDSKVSKIVVRSVNHPGNDGDPFLMKAAARVVVRHGGRVSPAVARDIEF